MSHAPDSVCALLIGGKIASIRDIPNPTESFSLGSLEVELKSGRVIHVRPDGRKSCAIVRGPAVIEPRGWRDLTPELPFAFARNAVVARAEPMKLDQQVVGLKVLFADGAQFVYDVVSGRPRLTTSNEDISKAIQRFAQKS